MLCDPVWLWGKSRYAEREKLLTWLFGCGVRMYSQNCKKMALNLNICIHLQNQTTVMQSLASLGQTVKIWTAMYSPSLCLLYVVLLQGKGVAGKLSVLFTHIEGGHKIRSDSNSWTRKVWLVFCGEKLTTCRRSEGIFLQPIFRSAPQQVTVVGCDVNNKVARFAVLCRLEKAVEKMVHSILLTCLV